MPGTYPAGPADLHADVVGVELTIDGLLVVADRLDLAEFTALGIRANIGDEDVRA
ncbi:MAG: ESX secretion-associated protein EspG, partial [Planctomycetota bacterium]